MRKNHSQISSMVSTFSSLFFIISPPSLYPFLQNLAPLSCFCSLNCHYFFILQVRCPYEENILVARKYSKNVTNCPRSRSSLLGVLLSGNLPVRVTYRRSSNARAYLYSHVSFIIRITPRFLGLTY